MIKLKSIGTKSAATGEDVAGAATSSMLTGPKDQLKNANDYLSTKVAKVKSFGSSIIESAGFKEFAGGAREGFSAASGGRSIDDLWDNLMCPPLGTSDRGRRNLGSRLDTSALWMRSSNCTVNALISSIKVKDGGGLSIDAGYLRNRLKDSVRLPFDDLDVMTQDMLIASMAGALGAGEGSVELLLGTGKAVLDPATYKDARSLTAMLSAVSGNSELAQLIYMQAELAVLNVILDKSIELGVADAIEQVLAKINDEDAARRFLLQRIRQAAQQSDLRTVQKAVQYVGSDGVLARVPEIVELITSHYQLPRGEGAPSHLASYTLLTDTLAMVKPDWHLARRGLQTVRNLTPFQMAGADATMLFQKFNDTVVDSLIGQAAPRLGVHGALMRCYPKMLVL